MLWTDDAFVDHVASQRHFSRQCGRLRMRTRYAETERLNYAVDSSVASVWWTECRRGGYTCAWWVSRTFFSPMYQGTITVYMTRLNFKVNLPEVISLALALEVSWIVFWCDSCQWQMHSRFMANFAYLALPWWRQLLGLSSASFDHRLQMRRG